MSTFIHAESRRLYSWWWDSHISPKNSKWLQENLTDMDLKVKAMIKLIEEDADSFARRAEMYYKKRPELMKFVEDFYRAYRALAERYDHATGALRHAHKTIAEAFPNHIPLALPDESPSISPGTEMGSCTPEMPSPLHPIFDPDDLQKDALGGPGYFHTVNRNVSYAEENETFATKKGLKQLNEKFSPREVTMRVKLHEGKVRKGLSFQEEEEIVSHSKIYTKPKILLEQEVKEKENARNEIQRLQEEVSQLSIENQKLKCNIELESTNLDSSRSEVQNLRDSITKLQSEKEAFFLQDQQSREIISSMETEIFRSKYEFGKLNEEIMMGIVKLCSAEEQCLSLEEENQRLKLELEQRKKVLEEIRALSVENQNLLEKEVKEKENAKIEIKRFHEELSLVSNENQNLKLRVLSESRHLQLSRTEVQNMRDAMSKLESEKEAALLQSQLSQESISSLETDIFQAKDEIGKLHVEIVMGIVKLCSAEEQLEKANQSLKLELEERKRVLEEIQMLSVESQNLLEQEVKEKENIKNEIECLQGEISQLSIENQNLKSQIVSKSKHLDAYGTEVQNLRNAMSILEIKKEEAVFKNQLSLEGISSLKSDVFRAKEEIRKLHEEVFMGIVKLYSAEEQHLTLKTSNLNLKSEHEERKRRVEDLRISLQESDVQRVEAERSLQFWERLYNTSQEKVEHMTLEIQSYFEKLQDIERSKMGLEEGMRQLEDVNYNLNESILAYDLKLKHLQGEIVSLKEIKSKLEDEINIHLEDINVLQQELDYIKDDRNELDIKHKSLIEQLEVASLNMGSLEILVKELQFVCAELKEGCRKLEDEKLLLFNELEDMETISERNAVLENSLSDAMENIRVLEDSCESLNAKDSTHAIEKATLASQIEVIAENMEKLSDKNIILEISLADANTELEGLRLKLKELEESSQFLSDENSNILLQNNALISQVESVRYGLTNLETKYAMLEVNNLNLEKEKAVSVTQVMELEDALKVKKIELDSLFQSSKMCLLSLENQINLLQEDIRFKEEELEVVQQEFTSYIIEILVLQICLCDMKDSFRTEKQKHESLIQSSEISLAALERQINLLQEEGQDRDEEFEEQQQKYMNSMLEIFILQKCLSEMKVKNFFLLQECQKHIANSRCAGELISQLEGSKLLLKEKNTLLVEHNARLMDGIDLLLESLDINKTLVNTDGSEDVFPQTILGEINNMLACISDVSDENQHLRTELSVYHTFLKQNSLEKVFIGQELGRMAGQLLVFQRDQDQLSESCKKLGQDVNDKERMNGSLKDELASLCRLLADLSKDFANLREENSALEEENDVILEEAMTLEHLHLFFRSSNAESMQFLKVLDHEIYSLIAVKSVHEEIREGEERLKVVENENKHLKDSPFLFEGLRSQTTVLEFDLFTARYFCEDLILQVEIGENLLKKKSMELLKAYHKLHCTQEEVTKLCTKLNAANMEVDEAKMVRLRFEEKVGVLLEGHACKDLEIVNTYEGNRILNEELNRLNGKIELLRKSEQHLSSELQKKICELDRCEGEITNLLNEVQVSAVNGALLEDKMFEWAIAYEGLEICALVQREMLSEVITLRNAHVFELQKKLDDLEKENRELKDIWNSCLPLFISLGNSFATVEKQAHQLANLHEDQGIPSTDPQEENNETRKRDLATIAGALALQNLSSKLEGLEMLMLDTNNHLKQERLLYASNLESARREIEELKLETSDHQVKRGKETSRGKDGQLMKDIELDQVSNSNALSRIQSAESEDQMLKLWETAERDYSNSFSNGHGVEAVQEFKSEQHSSELVAVKEVGVDKLEISSEMKETQDEWNIRLIERLSTAAKKLSALKTTAQELKANMERTRKIKHLRSSEHDAMHNKLKQSDKEILELVVAVEKLRKKVEEYSKSSKGEEMGWLDRRQVIDQVRTVLVPIEKLELELQEMHYFFLKLDEEAGRNRTPEGDQTPRVLLRNYIKGWRVGQGRKRSHFCGCVGPKTQE